MESRGAIDEGDKNVNQYIETITRTKLKLGKSKNPTEKKKYIEAARL